MVKGWYSSFWSFFDVLDLDDELLEVARRPDRDGSPEGSVMLPAVAGMEAVRVVADLPDLAAESVGVGRGIEARLERIARDDLVGRRPGRLR